MCTFAHTVFSTVYISLHSVHMYMYCRSKYYLDITGL